MNLRADSRQVENSFVCFGLRLTAVAAAAAAVQRCNQAQQVSNSSNGRSISTKKAISGFGTTNFERAARQRIHAAFE